MRRIVVTGGSGFIGTNLVEHFRAAPALKSDDLAIHSLHTVLVQIFQIRIHQRARGRDVPRVGEQVYVKMRGPSRKPECLESDRTAGTGWTGRKRQHLVTRGRGGPKSCGSIPSVWG